MEDYRQRYNTSWNGAPVDLWESYAPFLLLNGKELFDGEMSNTLSLSLTSNYFSEEKTNIIPQNPHSELRQLYVELRQSEYKAISVAVFWFQETANNSWSLVVSHRRYRFPRSSTYNQIHLIPKFLKHWRFYEGQIVRNSSRIQLEEVTKVCFGLHSIELWDFPAFTVLYLILTDMTRAKGLKRSLNCWEWTSHKLDIRCNLVIDFWNWPCWMEGEDIGSFQLYFPTKPMKYYITWLLTVSSM
jgi:hypothetical protein